MLYDVYNRHQIIKLQAEVELMKEKTVKRIHLY